MTAANLLTELTRLGIRLEARGDRLRYSPPSAVTPDLADRMKAHKGELLAILQHDPDAASYLRGKLYNAKKAKTPGKTPKGQFVPQANAAEEVAEDTGETDEAIEVIDPPDPCPKCGTLELWQSLAGNWRCLRCDPPTKARRLRERAARLKRTT